ncbi:COG2958 family protein [Aliagarivorans taiwanensis]|uniref:COG2958 family protein n=1 Tax=Aliagarivorans taiwanensis TaxID=561966 RepID=UPI0004248182|nr:hypothetical protein [Aliagarivorans taiwanensis]
MRSTTRVQMIIETLRAHPEQRFTARELAKLFIERYPQEIAEKRLNPRYDTEEKLIAQLAAEIGGGRTASAKITCRNIATKDKPRPRLYYWEPNPEQASDADPAVMQLTEVASNTAASSEAAALSEHELYPLLIEYLSEDQGLQCLRIDERKSRNSKGKGGNHWLHPDIVAMQPLDQGWNSAVRTSAQYSNQSSVRLWSFEVKKTLSKSNVRECFFQAVSNSSWANFGYLVATDIGNDVEGELQMLCGLHGIGVLLLNTDSLFDSQIMIPAQEKPSVDWQSVNRIVQENSDFHDFVEQVGHYQQTGRLIAVEWNK